MPLPPGPRAPRPIQTARWVRKPLQLFDDSDAVALRTEPGDGQQDEVLEVAEGVKGYVD